MAEFKPMVKMTTTEPSVTLKLKKGGPVKKMNGGVMRGLAKAPSSTKGSMRPTAGGPAGPVTSGPRRPLISPRPMAGGPGSPVTGGTNRPLVSPMAMKEGGETPKMHSKEMKKMSNLEKEMKHHASQKASKAHKGLKTGGVVKGQGGYKTGGVVKGQGGFKEGGMAKKHYATGGKVDSGAPVAMPKKPASAPVRVDRLAGTFKHGGDVNKPSKKC